MNMTRALKLTRKYILTLVMIALSILAVTPFLWMLSASLKATAHVFDFPIQWIPKQPIFTNYVEVWFAQVPFYRYFLNSVQVSALSVAGDVFTSALAGYAFAKIDFKGRNLAFLLYIATLMFPSQMLLIPRFVLYRLIGLYNTLWALILPGAFTAFGTFLLRQFFMTIPDELVQAAKIDGSSYFRTFTRIMLPLSKPALSTLTIFSFVATWNDYAGPLVFLHSKNLYTIPLGLLQFQDDQQTNYGAIMAASACSLIPIFVIFLVLQKHFIEGIAMSGIKG